MLENEIKCCPFCGSQNVIFSPKRKRFFCEDCEKTFDKPVMSEIVKENTIDTRKITVFLASSIKLTAERDLISSVAAESNGADHRTYIELNRCEYDNAIQMTGTQQEMYDSWIRDSDVFILVVSKSGIGEWTEKEIAIAAERKKAQNIKTLVFVQNGSEDGSSPENERWKTALSEYKDCFDELERYDDISDLYDKVKKHIAALRSDDSIGTVIKDCLRVGYDIVITGISEKSREYVYSLADKFNIINNENFRENEKNSLIFNLQINLNDPGNIRTNVNDYYFILAEGNKDAAKRIGECYRSNNPYMFLDVNIKESENSGSIVSEISSEINDNYLFIFQNRETLIGKDSIRSRLEKIKRAYGDFQKGLAYYNIGNYADAETPLLEAVKFGFVDACFYLGVIYDDDEYPSFTDLPKAEKYFRIGAEHKDPKAQFDLGLLLYNSGNVTEAEKNWRLAAEQGFLYAMINLGVLYNESGNISEAEKYYRMAAEEGHSVAQFNLGTLLKDVGELSKAEKYLRMAAEQGNIDAQSNLGVLWEEAGNFPEAAKYYLMAAEQGNPVAQSNLGLLLKKAGEFPAAEKYFRMAAVQGESVAQFELGLLFEDTGRLSEAEKYYRIAADHGHSDAQNNLGLLLKESGRLSEAEKYYRMAAEQGDSGAQYNLGALLKELGRLSEAEKYYRMAANQGNSGAQNNLGALLKESGRLPEAEKYYRMAADQGLAVSQKNLGILLRDAGDLPEAEKYLRMAAEQGDVGAQHILGVLLGKTNKFQDAVKYLCMAADQGDASAHHDLGVLFYITENYSEAVKYFRLAAEKGYIESQNALNALLEELGKF